MYINEKDADSLKEQMKTAAQEIMDKTAETERVFDSVFKDYAYTFAQQIDNIPSIKSMIVMEVAALVALLSSVSMSSSAFPEKVEDHKTIIDEIEEELTSLKRIHPDSNLIETLFGTLRACNASDIKDLEKDLIDKYRDKIIEERARSKNRKQEEEQEL